MAQAKAEKEAHEQAATAKQREAELEKVQCEEVAVRPVTEQHELPPCLSDLIT